MSNMDLRHLRCFVAIIEEIPQALQIKGLDEDLYDVGFAHSSHVGDGTIAVPVWSEPLHVAIPRNHPIPVFKHIPMTAVAISRDVKPSEGLSRFIKRASNLGIKQRKSSHYSTAILGEVI